VTFAKLHYRASHKDLPPTPFYINPLSISLMRESREGMGTDIYLVGESLNCEEPIECEEDLETVMDSIGEALQ